MELFLLPLHVYSVSDKDNNNVKAVDGKTKKHAEVSVVDRKFPVEKANFITGSWKKESRSANLLCASIFLIAIGKKIL